MPRTVLLGYYPRDTNTSKWRRKLQTTKNQRIKQAYSAW